MKVHKELKHCFSLSLLLFMILAASVALVSADTKTKYPPYEDAWGDKYGEKNGGGYWFSNYYVNRQTGNIRVYALGEGSIVGGAAADAIGFMGTYWPYAPGGCPYVYPWNGTQYVVDNNILGASEASNGTDVEDYYILEQTLVPTWEGRRGSIYSVQISEFENEHSYLDQAKLIAVEHSSDVNVAVTPIGEFLTYRDPHQPISCIDNHGIDRLQTVKIIDNNYYTGYPHDYLLVDFGELDVSDGAKLVLRANIEFKKDMCIHIQIQNATENWTDITALRTRENWATEIVNLSGYLPDSRGQLRIRLFFKGIHKVDYIGLDTSAQDDIKILSSQLISAMHSKTGQVRSRLIGADRKYAELTPGEKIRLKFAFLKKPKEPCDFVMFSLGHYLKLKPRVDVGSAIKVVSSASDPIVSVTGKIKLVGWAKVFAISTTPLAAIGSWYFSIELWVYDYTADSWVTTTVIKEWSDEIKSPGEGIPVWREKHWNSDYDVQSSFSAINGHCYGVWIGVYAYASGSAIGGDGYGLVDFDHSSYGTHDTLVKYIHFSW